MHKCVVVQECVSCHVSMEIRKEEKKVSILLLMMGECMLGEIFFFILFFKSFAFYWGLSTILHTKYALNYIYILDH